MGVNTIAIQTDKAPKAIGPYSQALKVGDTIYISGQIPLDPQTGEMVEGDMQIQIERVLENIAAVADAAGGSERNIVKLTVYLTDMDSFPIVNELMEKRFSNPYPARAAVGVTALPKGAQVEMDAIVAL